MARRNARADASLPNTGPFSPPVLDRVGRELRGSLERMLACSQSLLDGSAGPLGPEQHRLAAEVRRSGETLRKVLEDYLALAGLEAGPLPLEPVSFDLADLIQGVATALLPRATRKELRLETAPAPGLPRVFADPARVRQVLTHLLDNALAYTHAGGVTISTQLFDRAVAVHVVDTGPGIPADTLSRLFTDLGVPAAERPQAGGAGLGLALCKRLVTRLGGDIWASSRLGEGSSFTFTVPRAQGAAAGPSGGG